MAWDITPARATVAARSELALSRVAASTEASCRAAAMICGRVRLDRGGNGRSLEDATPPSSQMSDVLMLLISPVPANDRPLPSPVGGHRLVAGAGRAQSRADECHRCAAFSNQQLALATVIDRGGRSATLHDRGHDLWILT
jgi:hypothetical protein